jgi:hypothetical protein
VVFLVCAATAVSVSGLAADLEKLLDESTYVYISSSRKDGSLGKPAEIWYLYHDGAVYVGTRPTSWRVRRIKWGQPKAKIWVGKTDGPSFEATGSVVDDDAIEQLILDTFGKKYPDGWKKHADNFRNGFKDGNRVVVKYALVE